MKIGTLGTKPVLLGTLGLIGVSTYLGTKNHIFESHNSAALSATKRDVPEQNSLIFFTDDQEGSGEYVEVGSGETPGNEFWATLIENGEMSDLLPEEGFQLKKSGGGKKGKGPGRAAKREKNKKARWERKQKQKNTNRNWVEPLYNISTVTKKGV